MGQSNANARDWYGEGLANQSQSPWIRSFGSWNSSSIGVPVDRTWDMADGVGESGHAAVGAWALRLAEILLGELQVPIAVLNGASGGTTIAKHLRNDLDPTDLWTLYGRLLWRAREARLDDTVRCLFWYQGESDGESAETYPADFATLRSAWLEDYPALETVYLFQTRVGCTTVGAGVREFQRIAPDLYPDLEGLSTEAVPGHDGCHYYTAGYLELAERVARLVLRDFYGSPATQDVDSPDLASANFHETDDRIDLVFRNAGDTLVWESGVEAYFTFDDATVVTGGSVTAPGVITLELGGPSEATAISYVGHALDGPSITNGNGVGAYTFFGFPLSRPEP
jgi:hypothetical protein